MKWKTETLSCCHKLLTRQQLPAGFNHLIEKIYLPLSKNITDEIHERKKSQPLLVSISGAQGTGKSTLCNFLKIIIETEFQLAVTSLSLDDFYLPKIKRNLLAKTIHPLLATRGVPGTHDLDLLENTINTLLKNESCLLPKFNKATDERIEYSQWKKVQNGVQLILFEGWCNNSPSQSKPELANPVNELEKIEDQQSIWRCYVNEKLIEYHQRVFDKTDLSIFLQAPSFENVFDWRKLQEQKLKAVTDQQTRIKLLDDNALERFIQHFERISRYSLAKLPALADYILPLNANHSISKIVEKKANIN